MKCPFEIGEKIVCIKRYDYTNMEHVTTIGKIYETFDNSHLPYDTICILGDHGCSVKPNWNFFIPLKELRKLKIKKLNETK